jgi:hypothetical protein
MLPDGWRATKHAQHGVWETEKKKNKKKRSQSEREEKRRRASE